MDFSNLHFYYLNRFSSEKKSPEIINEILLKEINDILINSNTEDIDKIAS